MIKPRDVFSGGAKIFLLHAHLSELKLSFAGPSIMIQNFCRSWFGYTDQLRNICRFFQLIDMYTPHTLFSLDKLTTRRTHMVHMTKKKTSLALIASLCCKAARKSTP